MYEGLLESEGYVSPEAMVFRTIQISQQHQEAAFSQLGFGVVVCNVSYDVFSKGVVSANAEALETGHAKGVSIGGVCNIGLCALVIVFSPCAPAACILSLSTLIGQADYIAVVIKILINSFANIDVTNIIIVCQQTNRPSDT